MWRKDTRLTMGEMWLEGSAGVLRMDGAARLWRKPHGGIEVLHPYSWPETGFAGDSVHRLQAHVISHLSEGTYLDNSAREYLRNIEIEEAIYRSSMENRHIRL